MLQSKFIKCVILTGIILLLFLSPGLVSGVVLSPDNNTVRCRSFLQTVDVLYEPGQVRVFFSGSLAGEDLVQQLTLQVFSYSKNFDANKIEVRDKTLNARVPVELLDSHKSDDGDYYWHTFRLTFDPPLDESERDINIHYTTIATKWSGEDTMYLKLPVWSTDIILEDWGKVWVKGVGEEFKFKDVYNPATGWILSNNDRMLIVSCEELIGNSRKYIWIEAPYTPAYPSQWYVWDQYQKAEESLRWSTASVILAIFAIAASVITTVYAVKKTRALTWELKIMKKMKLEKLKKSSSTDNILSKKVKGLDKKIEIGKVDNLLLFASSLVGLLFVLIQYILADVAFMLFLPLLVIGLIIPVNIGYFKGALKNSTIHSIKGWIHFLIGLGNYIWFVILMVLIVRLNFKNDLLIPVSLFF